MFVKPGVPAVVSWLEGRMERTVGRTCYISYGCGGVVVCSGMGHEFLFWSL